MSARVESISPTGRTTRRGLCLRRLVAVAVFVAILLPIAVLHSRSSLALARTELAIARREGDAYLATIARRSDLRAELRELDAANARRRDAWAVMPVSAVIATVVNRMPSSVAFEGIDVTHRSPDDDAAKLLAIEIDGIAPDEATLDAFVAGLSDIRIFDRPNVRATTPRTLRGRAVVGFEITLDVVGQPRPVAVGEERRVR